VPHSRLALGERVGVVSWRFGSRVFVLHPSTMAWSHRVPGSFDSAALRRALAPHRPLAFVLLLAAGLRLLYIDAPLLDAHRWRQVDTAFMARAFYEGGINPLRPEANWGGAHGYVESEFPLLPAMVAVLYHVFGPDETWGRLVVAAFSIGAVVLTYLLARLLLGAPAGLAAATLVAVSPSAVFYGRAVMPDTLMVFFSLAALLGFIRYGESGRGRALMWGSVSLGLAILVKLPGVLVLAPIACALWKSRGRSALRDRRLLSALTVPCLAAAAWYAYAYSIYLDSGLTFGVIGTTKTYPLDVGPGPWPTAFSKWSSVALLTSADFYRTLFARVYFVHLTPPGFAMAVIGLLAWRTVSWRRVADGWLLAMLAFIAVAGAGHMGHDYYQLPLVPICALYFAAVAWPAFDAGWIARTVGPGVLSRGVTAAAIGAVGLVCFLQSGVIERHFRPANLDERLWLAAQAIDGPADNSGLMVVVDDYGVNSPMLLYFAHARGWSLDADTATVHVVSGLRLSKGARYFATTRWAEVQRKQPELAMFLESRRELPLNNAPANTVLFDLTQSR
jgi:predicted membrane-bound dolichyl-phosphate-mannose-protein mannosyltransferase